MTVEVGQRVYWAGSCDASLLLGVVKLCVCSGVVVSVGDAVTQVWHDEPAKPGRGEMLTFAKDKLNTNRESVRDEVARLHSKWEAHRRAMMDEILASSRESKAAADPRSLLASSVRRTKELKDDRKRWWWL